MIRARARTGVPAAPRPGAQARQGPQLVREGPPFEAGEVSPLAPTAATREAFLALRLHFFQWPRTSTFFIPVLVLAVPLFDTALVTVSRLRRGLPVTEAGLDHSSHRLVRLGLPPPVAVAVLWRAQAAYCLGAVAVARLGPPVDVATMVAAAVTAGVGAVVLGRAMPGPELGCRQPGRSAA